MKIIHCADLHLDSKLNANLDKEKAKERKAELLHTFERMIQYAVQHGIEAVLIAGDLFDTGNVSATTGNAVRYHITMHPEIVFYYLQGNHDGDNFPEGMDNIPENLKLFHTEWTTYEAAGGAITISGLKLSRENSCSAYSSLVLNAEKFNIVMLHGQEADGTAKEKAEVINLKLLKNKGIDYLALGHVHAYKQAALDSRGTYCYSGCLEGRGFDECGEHGFVVLDIDENTGNYTQEFVSFAQRKLYTVYVDVTDCMTTAEMISKAEAKLAETGCETGSLVKIVLVGMLDVECEKNLSYFLSGFQTNYYYVKVSDETSLKLTIENYMLDESLKGEFVRQVMEDNSISEEDKRIIIRYGLQAIAGEEVE